MAHWNIADVWVHVHKHICNFTLCWLRALPCWTGFGFITVLCSIARAQNKHAGIQAQTHYETKMWCFCLGRNSSTTAAELSLWTPPSTAGKMEGLRVPQGITHWKGTCHFTMQFFHHAVLRFLEEIFHGFRNNMQEKLLLWAPDWQQTPTQLCSGYSGPLLGWPYFLWKKNQLALKLSLS